ncbi:hypothetical protein ACFLS4_01835 [Bacteroidota bacterium]
MRNVYIIFALFAIILLGNNNKLFAQSGQELVDICGMVAGDATYLKDFQVKLEAAKPGEEPPTARHSVVLSKNTKYRFSLCNSKDFQGEAIIQLYDNNRLLGTNYIVATGKSYPTFDFKCTTTGVYHIWVEFKEGKQGLAIALLSFVERF